MIRPEAILHRHVCGYLKSEYPTVLFRSDHEAGRRRTKQEMINIKRLNSGRGWPDLFIAEPSRSNAWAGLFLELKTSAIYTKSGKLKKDEHLAEQDAVLGLLRAKGFNAQFAVGFDEAQKLIDIHLAHLKSWSKDQPGGNVF